MRLLVDAYSVKRTLMPQKKLICADKIRMICENLWESDVSAFHSSLLSACSLLWRLTCGI